MEGFLSCFAEGETDGRWTRSLRWRACCQGGYDVHGLPGAYPIARTVRSGVTPFLSLGDARHLGSCGAVLLRSPPVLPFTPVGR